MSAERSYIIPVWNGVLSHRRRIGAAIWVFLWCIDRTTREENGAGLVLGGTVVTAARIGKECDRDSPRNVQRHLEHLEALGYLGIERKQYGLVLKVFKSTKFRKTRPDKSVDLDAKSVDLNAKSVDVIRKEIAVDLAVEITENKTPLSEITTQATHPEKQLQNLPSEMTGSARPDCPSCGGKGVVFVLLSSGLKRPRPCPCRTPIQQSDTDRQAPLGKPAKALEASA